MSSIYNSDGFTPFLKMTRTFHPVGQGAFYSEVFWENEVVKFVVVYDCGTESNERSFNKVISDFKGILPEDHRTIDVLFLSHLHKDHINGLDMLLSGVTVKKTVIPMLPEEIILVTRVKNALEERSASEVESNDRIVSELCYSGGRSARFGEIVTIPPSDEFLGQFEWFPRGVTPEKGAITISISGTDPIWMYVPMNSITGNDLRAINFSKEIRKIDGVFDAKGNLDTSQLVRGKRTELRDAYRKVMKNANENLYSLVVYSRPIDKLVYDVVLARNSRCLYTGDLDTKGNEKKKLLNRLMLKFPIDPIGVFQVPHHGAKDNWEKAFLGSTPRNYVVSVGSNNGYHHPDFWAMEAIRNVSGNVLHIVTEDATKIWPESYCLFV